MQDWAGNVEKQIQGPFVAGQKISVADLKLYILMSWIKKGIVDHIPENYFDEYRNLNDLFNAVANHPKVIEWYSRKYVVTNFLVPFLQKLGVK